MSTSPAVTSSTMRALVLETPNTPFVLTRVAIPSVGEGQMLVRILASGRRS